MNLQSATPTGLARLLQQREETAEPWDADDLATMLRHQLDAPLVADIGPSLSGDSAAQPGNFGELLGHQAPSIELLKVVKRFAKHQIRSSSRAIPSEVAYVLYYATVLIAYDRCNEWISNLTRAKICVGLKWALDQPWLDPRLVVPFSAGLEALATKAR